MLARANDYVELERYLWFPEARLTLELEGDAVIVTSDKFARCVELSGSDGGDEFGWFFEDNYFDLFPWEKKRVRILGRHKKGVITAKPHYSPYSAEICCSLEADGR